MVRTNVPSGQSGPGARHTGRAQQRAAEAHPFSVRPRGKSIKRRASCSLERQARAHHIGAAPMCGAMHRRHEWRQCQASSKNRSRLRNVPTCAPGRRCCRPQDKSRHHRDRSPARFANRRFRRSLHDADRRNTGVRASGRGHGRHARALDGCAVAARGPSVPECHSRRACAAAPRAGLAAKRSAVCRQGNA